MPILLIIVLGFVLRIININQSLWLDEATSLLVARDLSVNEILTQFSPGDFHPPLYYLLLKAWISVFGASEISARSLSILFGITTVWVVFQIGKRLFDKRAGLLAAMLLATSGLHIYYSQEARMYVPAAFLASLSVLLFLRILQAKEKSSADWISFILVNLLLLYTDYTPVLLLAFFGFYLLIFERQHLRKNIRQWLGVIFAILALLFPWVPTLSRQLLGGVSVRASTPGWWVVLGKTSIKQILLVPLKFLIGRISAYDKVFYAASVSIPAIFVIGLFIKSLLAWRKTRFIWIWFALPLVIAAVLGFWIPIFSYFRFIFVLPVFYLVLAYGALSIKRKWLQNTAIVGLVLLNLISSGIYLLSPRFHREDWRTTVSFIETNSVGNNAATIFVSSGQQEAYRYYAKSVPSYGPEGLKDDHYAKIWLMRYAQPIFDSQDQVRRMVESQGYKKQAEHDFNGVVIWEYER